MTKKGEIAAENMVSFVRALRSEGFSVTPSTTNQLVDAAAVVGLHNARDVREAFRSITVTRRSQNGTFDATFERFFAGEIVYALDDLMNRFAPPKQQRSVQRIGAVGTSDAENEGLAEEVLDVVGGSSEERLMDADFADLDDQERAAIAQLLASMSWSPSSVLSRRWKSAASSGTPDLRRTMRTMAGPKGDLLPLSFTERRPRQRPLIVLADISGSMERYSEMLLYFVHGAQHRFARVESFVFATRLTRITRQLRLRNPSDALEQVARKVPDWSGGTRIGDAIGAFNRSWSRRVGGGGPIVLIVSDGWDTGDPDHLALEMRRLKRSVHRLIWLNPLAGHDSFTPDARGMAAALPHLDELLAGGTARNLVDLIDLLQTGKTQRRSVATP